MGAEGRGPNVRARDQVPDNPNILFDWCIILCFMITMKKITTKKSKANYTGVFHDIFWRSCIRQLQSLQRVKYTA